MMVLMTVCSSTPRLAAECAVPPCST
jgi:hypothetical protein